MLLQNQNEKAKYRVGQKVTCDYYPGEVYKVVAKEWDLHGVVHYTIEPTAGTDWYKISMKKSGLRQKYLNKA